MQDEQFPQNNAHIRPPTLDDILTASTTRMWLEKLGHSPKHPLGQNFLVDPNIVRKSIELAQVLPGERVVEIGPGLGTLTTALIASGAEVWAVEFDATLFTHLQSRLEKRAEGRLHLLHGDAVQFPLAGLTGSLCAEKPFKIVANLPYAIATPWMDGVLRQPNLPERMVLMLQKENADRFTAPEGTKSRGAISIFIEAAYEKDKGHPVSRRSFLPPPAVDSTLLNLKRKSNTPRFSEQTKLLIRRFFTQRRKQIGALCRKDPLSETLTQWLEQSRIDPRLRPEALSLDQWRQLDCLLTGANLI